MVMPPKHIIVRLSAFDLFFLKICPHRLSADFFLRVFRHLFSRVVIPVCVQSFVDNVRFVLPLLCQDGNFFRRGKSWEVEPVSEWAARVRWSGSGLIGSVTLPHPHSLFGNAPPDKGEENCRLAPIQVNHSVNELVNIYNPRPDRNARLFVFSRFFFPVILDSFNRGSSVFAFSSCSCAISWRFLPSR